MSPPHSGHLPLCFVLLQCSWPGGCLMTMIPCHWAASVSSSSDYCMCKFFGCGDPREPSRIKTTSALFDASSAWFTLELFIFLQPLSTDLQVRVSPGPMVFPISLHPSPCLPTGWLCRPPPSPTVSVPFVSKFTHQNTLRHGGPCCPHPGQ